MRSAEAGAVPEPSAYQRPGVRHHAPGPACRPRGRPEVCAARTGEYPAATAGAVSGAVRALVCGLCWCGMSLCPSGYLVSEHVT
jgi:hypothetical protein